MKYRVVFGTRYDQTAYSIQFETRERELIEEERWSIWPWLRRDAVYKEVSAWYTMRAFPSLEEATDYLKKLKDNPYLEMEF